MPSASACRQSRVRRLLLWAAPLAWLGCGGGGTDIVLPSLSVTTATDGVELDPDGYSLTIDGGQNRPIGLAATLVVDRLTDGEHLVELSGLAANCAPQGQNPQSVTVRSGATSTVSFAVRCNATSGSIEVATSTTGTGLDSDGFTLVVDAAPWGPIGAAATASVAGLPPGSHLVGLTGLAANCVVTGENPRQVTVSPGEAAVVPFEVTCTEAGPAPGTLTVSAATTGSNPDPDGYGVSLDGGASQPLGVNASVSLSGVSATQHSVQLTGVAANCTVAGTNPRSVAVPAGGTANVAFSIACASTGPTTGSLEITTATTGSSPDPDGYTVSIDGGNAQAIAVNGSRSVTSLSPGSHSVRLAGVAPNCTLSGNNPRSVAVTAGQSTAVAFAVACATPAPTTGNLTIRVTTTGPSPDDGYTVSVDGGNAQGLTTNGTRTVQNLAPGEHSALLGGIASNCTAGPSNPQSTPVAAGQTATITFQVSCVVAGPSVNFRIEGMYFTQSTQDLAGEVPLVEGRDGYLRVFVTASGPNNVRPEVRVRFLRGGTTVQTLTIAPNGGSTPSAVQEGALQSSWNIRVPGSLIQANTAVVADVDPDNALAETNENDNTYPASGTARTLSVQAVPAAAITFVPIRQSADGSVGEVSNPSQLLDLPRRMYPLNAVSANIGDVFTVSGPLNPLDDNGQWVQAVTDLEGKRVESGATDRTYIGLVRLNYGPGFGIVGIGFNTPGTSTALVTDASSDVREVLAHELGHTFGMLHTPCGTPPSVDRNYPYQGGRIGVYGLDVASEALKLPSQPDIMGYCESPWISDYTYQKVLTYRRANPLRAEASVQPSLLVWGHIRNGHAVLEPVFRVVTRPHLPSSRGPYTIEAKAADGGSLFSLSFDAQPVPDDPQGSRHFVFAVPLDQALAAQLGSLRLSGPGIQVSALTQSAGRLRRGPSAAGADEVTTEAEPGAVRLKWDAAVHPMIMVRDPDSGEVLSFARGGDARVWTSKSTVDLELSDGVQTQRLRRAISR